MKTRHQNSQATKMTRQQLLYLQHWSKLGYQYTPGDEVPEDVSIRPPALERCGKKELAVSAILFALILIGAWAGGAL